MNKITIYFLVILLLSACKASVEKDLSIEKVEIQIDEGDFLGTVSSKSGALLRYFYDYKIEDSTLLGNGILTELDEIKCFFRIADTMFIFRPFIEKEIEYGYFRYRKYQDKNDVVLNFEKFIPMDTLDSSQVFFNHDPFERDIVFTFSKEGDNTILFNDELEIMGSVSK